MCDEPHEGEIIGKMLEIGSSRKSILEDVDSVDTELNPGAWYFRVRRNVTPNTDNSEAGLAEAETDAEAEQQDAGEPEWTQEEEREQDKIEERPAPQRTVATPVPAPVPPATIVIAEAEKHKKIQLFIGMEEQIREI